MNKEYLWYYEEILFWHFWCYDIYAAEYAAYYQLKKKPSDQRNFNFFDSEGGKKDRDEAIERVGGNAEPAWKGASLDIGYELARPKTWFSTDEIWHGLYVRGIQPPQEPRAMGWVMAKLQKDGVIEPSGDMRPSGIRKCHHRPKRMWRGK